jgi:hypothetical protein
MMPPSDAVGTLLIAVGRPPSVEVGTLASGAVSQAAALARWTSGTVDRPAAPPVAVMATPAAPPIAPPAPVVTMPPAPPLPVSGRAPAPPVPALLLGRLLEQPAIASTTTTPTTLNVTR